MKVDGIMNITMISVGKLKMKQFKKGVAMYQTRLSRYCHFKTVIVRSEPEPEPLSDKQATKIKAIEGQRILAKIKPRDYVFALAILGKERTSEKFAKEIRQLTTYGHSDLVFVIGGSLGLSPEVLKRADTQVSFGRFTMPHELMRVVLAEQIYRAFMINHGTPYHK